MSPLAPRRLPPRLAALLLLAAIPTRAATLRVPEHHPTIQDAIAAARDGDTVLVAPGIYAERIRFLGKAIVVRAAGGADATILDGGGAGSVVTFDLDEGGGSLLEGFTIRHGTGTPVGMILYGGGIQCTGASPTIRACVIRENQADIGGGVACWLRSHPVLADCDVSDNEAKIRGGGIACDEESFPEILRGSVTGNSAARGGGGILSTARSGPLLDGCLLARNRSGNGGAGLYLDGASSVNVFGCTFDSNVAESGAGAGIACLSSDLLIAESTVRGNVIEDTSDGGGIFCFQSQVEIRDCVISGNRSGYDGGGILCWYGTDAVIEGNHIRENVAAHSGGGIAMNWYSGGRIARNRIEDNAGGKSGGGLSLMTYSDPSIESNRIVGNQALSGAGFMCNESSPGLASNLLARNSAGRWGGGAYIMWNSSPVLTNDTFAANTAGEAGGGILCSHSDPLVYNSILWENAAPEGGQVQLRSGAAPVVVHCAVEGGWPGEGNLDEDPLFASSGRGDWRLRLGSPCLDTGAADAPVLPLVDLEGDPRILDGDLDGVAVVDIGADEADPGIAVRFGGVNAGAGALEDVLRINGSAGDDRRVFTAPTGAPLTLTVDAAPAGPREAPFVLYLWTGEPDAASVTPLPHGLGWTAFPTPLTESRSAPPEEIWNNLGHPRYLGFATRPSDPAPSVLFSAPRGSTHAATVTFQGFLLDDASSAEAPASVTNALVVRIVD